ncbi:MAG: ammonium transporter, partial [Treponema sp.]|nr:ammonium transporter [Treponema sp.]
MRKKLFIMALLLGCIGGVSLFAEETLESLGFSLDVVWLFIGSILVFIMQAGFALVETGLTRAKNATNIT